MNSRPVRPLTHDDIPRVIALSESVGWDYATPELSTAFAAGQLFGVSAANGGLAACAAIFPYEGLASLGLVIVDPLTQGQGLGGRVTRAAMAGAGDRPILLVATDAGQPLYERLGFRTLDTVHKLLGDRYRPAADSPDARLDQAPPPTFDELLALDTAAFGARREDFLRVRLAQAAACHWARHPDGRLAGFALAIQGPAVRVLGPFVAGDPALALALVHRLAGAHPGALRIDVPSRHEALIDRLLASGFHLNRVPPVMGWGLEALPGSRQDLYAIAAQAYG